MKATVNIGLREVTIEYSIDKKDQNNVPFDERSHNWETLEKTINSKKVQCKQTFSFTDADDWQTIQLLDGRMIDFHYDYENRSNFADKNDWALHIFQGYEFTDGEPQLYDKQVVKKVKVVL